MEYGPITTLNMGIFQRLYEVIICPILFYYSVIPYIIGILKIRKEVGIESKSMSSGIETKLFLLNAFFGFDVF